MDTAREQPADSGNVLNQRGVTVSSSHITSRRSSYPLHSVRSASTRINPKPMRRSIGFIVVGLVVVLIALTLVPEETSFGPSVDMRRDGISDDIPLDALIVGIPGLALIIVGIMWLVRLKSMYTVVLHAPAGTKEVLTDSDEQWIAQVVAAVNKAIEAREPGAAGPGPSPGQR
jgi:hypothetical protein